MTAPIRSPSGYVANVTVKVNDESPRLWYQGFFPELRSLGEIVRHMENAAFGAVYVDGKSGDHVVVTIEVDIR